MFKKILIVAALTLALAACDDGNGGMDEYGHQAQKEAHKAMQTQYASQQDCQRVFNQPNDCYRGQNGAWFSPMYFLWGAIIHNNGMVSYNNSVPLSGGRWVTSPSVTSAPVNFGNSASFVSARTSSLSSSAMSASASRGGFGSTARGGGFSSGGG